MSTALTALLAATAVHAGFQTTVTLLVYPALARVPAEQWADAHRRHSRTITPLVGVVYGALLLSTGWAVVTETRLWTLVTAVAVGATLVTTGFAARLHGRLGTGHDRQLLATLLRVDRVRAVTAVTALVACLVAVCS
ncbi:hypothetical protein Kisp01_26870 [Kineosporia sp. NBRC 101677]|uniref:DUF1772 domain-containing protein n=1 Tax=Kineosporia sp. NBRC 101677 TaxID=3032197 RepID=UPI0024A1E384|nr:DUF1772 domain-containing protein [Kineosporia sp. NBRC 101677]GLY15672.1 hypothetical protein Kisp01_26870 [Kineosporia sp. NBRC 101677]